VRILMLNDLPAMQGPGHGGAEVVLERLGAALAMQGHEVRLHSRPGPRTGLAKIGALWDPWEARRLAAVVRDFRPDVVHAHNLLRELSASVLGPVRHLPVVMTVHDLRLAGVVLGQRSRPERLLDTGLKQPLDARAVRRVVRHFVTVSETAADVLRHKGFRPITVIAPLGPDWPAVVVPPSSSVTLCFVGRLSADKGVDVALAAFGALGLSDARLVVVGDGPERAALEAVAPAGVSFLGRLPSAQLAEVVAASRAVVVPSLPTLRPETSSLTAIEAAWSGRAVVASDDPAVAAIVQHLACGLITPAGDAAALAAAFGQILTDDVLADGFGTAGAVAARAAYAPEIIAAEYLELYRSVT
jgi:glycosyltransferase involved in cell wall biosynthesis